MIYTVPSRYSLGQYFVVTVLTNIPQYWIFPDDSLQPVISFSPDFQRISHNKYLYNFLREVDYYFKCSEKIILFCETFVHEQSFKNIWLLYCYMMPMRKMMNHGLSAMITLLFLFLFIQFFLGMYINLFVVIPVISHFLMMGYGPYSGFQIVMVHMFLGILIGFISLGILFLSIGTGQRNILISAVGLFLSVLLAGIDGLVFLFDGQNNVNSYLMSTGFILAIFFSILLVVYVYVPNSQISGKPN